VHSPEIPGKPAKAEVHPGSDHVRVRLKIASHAHETLGIRLQSPRALTADQLTQISREQNAGPIPTSWAEWSAHAENLLLTAIPDLGRGYRGRGQRPKFRLQTLSRPQVG
jgi:hypothetical protein